VEGDRLSFTVSGGMLASIEYASLQPFLNAVTVIGASSVVGSNLCETEIWRGCFGLLEVLAYGQSDRILLHH
jgi:hypothetical protein